MDLYERSPLYQIMDEGRLIIAHAGIRSDYIGQYSSKVKTFVLYGDINGSKHPDGSPVRKDWAKSYKGESWIVYGHTPVPEARQVNHTYNIDTGCVFGGKLTAVRYPEMDLQEVPSTMPYIAENSGHLLINQKTRHLGEFFASMIFSNLESFVLMCPVIKSGIPSFTSIEQTGHIFWQLFLKQHHLLCERM